MKFRLVLLLVPSLLAAHADVAKRFVSLRRALRSGRSGNPAFAPTLLASRAGAGLLLATVGHAAVFADLSGGWATWCLREFRYRHSRLRCSLPGSRSSALLSCCLVGLLRPSRRGGGDAHWADPRPSNSKAPFQSGMAILGFPAFRKLGLTQPWRFNLCLKSAIVCRAAGTQACHGHGPAQRCCRKYETLESRSSLGRPSAAAFHPTSSGRGPNRTMTRPLRSGPG